jgi:hypothetical protein
VSAVIVDLEQLAELVARRVVEMLVERQEAPAAGLVDAATLARLLGISRSTVYEHAAALGAIEAGSGSKPRLRFDVEKARRAWSARTVSERSQKAETPAPAPVRRRRRSSKSGSAARLLPVRGREVA